MKRFLLAALAAFSVVGCGNDIRPDVVMPSVQANYPTAESTACGEFHHGLGVCHVTEGRPLDDVGFTLQTYYKGTVTVRSADCEIRDSFRYTGSQQIRYNLAGPAERSCLVSFLVSPEYPKESDSGLRIHSFKGHLWVKVLKEGEKGLGFTSKVAEDGSARIGIPVEFTNPARVIVRGCGSKLDRNITPVNGEIALELNDPDIMPRVGITSCILQGAVDAPESRVFFSWMVWGYDKRFVPLPKPSLELDDGALIVESDPNVSVVALDQNYVINTEAEFEDFDLSKAHFLRLITVSARLTVGLWSPETRRWTWMQ